MQICQLYFLSLKGASPTIDIKFLSQHSDYHPFRKHLYSIGSVIIYKGKIVIPPSLRQNGLSVLYAANQCISSMISRAETSIFWLGITTDIHATRANYNHYNQITPSQAALPPTSPIIVAYPFQCICAYYF